MNERLLTAPWQELLPMIVGGEFLFWIARYAIIAGLACVVLIPILKRWFPERRIQPRDPGRAQLRRELLWSFPTMAVFASLSWIIVLLKRADVTVIYTSVEEYGWGYYILSWALLLLIHDAYFYPVHRFMHWKPVYRFVHSVHHRSTNPTPLAALAFHPLEAVLEYLFFVPLILVLPLHVSVLAGYPMLMLLLNVYGHLGYELLPRSFTKHPVGKFLLTATLHNQHHKKFHYNYGLWFFWWDRIFGTLDPAQDVRHGEAGGRNKDVTSLRVSATGSG
jgi:Delta7-sterol 5-desaturase